MIPLGKQPHDDFTERAVESFESALRESREIWPDAERRESYLDWAETMRALEVLDRRTRAAVIATLLPLVAIGEETDGETALRNMELLFVSLLESAAHGRRNGN